MAQADMARELGENDSVDRLRKTFLTSMAQLEKQLWTGTYYRLCHDFITGKSNDGLISKTHAPERPLYVLHPWC
jgi:hypothetical protein